MGCCDSPGQRTKWGIFALLAASAVVCFSISTPVYFGTLAAHDPESFEGCGNCIQDFGMEVLHSVNATDIANKLEKIHERNEKMHKHHHHHHHDDGDMDLDECITNKDIEGLKPDLESLVFPGWKDECKPVCSKVLKVVPLAASLSSVCFFVALVCAICSMIPLCMLCCNSCCQDKPCHDHRMPPHYLEAPVAGYSNAYGRVPVGTEAAAASEETKPLLQQ